jgi:hypothetical protein
MQNRSANWLVTDGLTFPCGLQLLSICAVEAKVFQEDTWTLESQTTSESDKIEVENRKLVEQARATGEEDEA